MIFEIPSKASDEMQRHTRNALEFQIFCVIFTLVQLTSQNCPSPFMYIHILLFILCLHNFSINSFAMIIKLFCCMGHLFLTGCFVSNASIEKVIFCFYQKIQLNVKSLILREQSFSSLQISMFNRIRNSLSCLIF